jgi:hypothetical protein
VPENETSLNETSFKGKLTSIMAVVLGMLVLFVVGAGLWEVRFLFPFVGWLFVADVIIGLCLVPFVGFMVIMAFVNRGHYITNEQHGGYLRGVFGKIIPLPPLTPVTPRVAGGTKVTEITPQVPRLAELIEEKSLVRYEGEQALMFQGFRADLSIRYGTWPGVIGVAGMQNVGKSVTIETLAIIALMQHAHVVVCDTHHTKARSLYKKLQTLEGYITFARNESEVLRQAENFSQELVNRKAGSEPFPYVFILDEAASVIRSNIGEQITTIIEEASQEGHGYNLHLILAIHDFSKDGLGDARIRDFLNWIYCHRMQSGQSKFVAAFNTPKNKKVIAALPPGHCVTKDEVNDVEYLIMPLADSKDALLARKGLDELSITTRQREIAAPVSSPVPETFGYKTEDLRQRETSSSIPPLAELTMKIPVATQEENELQQIVTAWGEGYKSIRKAAAITGIGENRTRTLIAQAQVRGLIEG